jgi:hypothetical protein
LASEHLTLDRFEPVDLSLELAVVVGKRQPRLYRIMVFLRPLGEATQRRDATLSEREFSIDSTSASSAEMDAMMSPKSL